MTIFCFMSVITIISIFPAKFLPRKIFKTGIRIICIVRDGLQLYGYFFTPKRFQKHTDLPFEYFVIIFRWYQKGSLNAA